MGTLENYPLVFERVDEILSKIASFHGDNAHQETPEQQAVPYHFPPSVDFQGKPGE